MYEMIPPLLAVFTAFGLGAMGLAGLRMWVAHNRAPDLEELADTIREQLKEEVREEIYEIHKRLDFAERMFAQARLPKGAAEDEAGPDRLGISSDRKT